MKSIFKILTIAILLLPLSTYAQNYKTTVINTDYKDIDGQVVLTKTHPWVNPWFRIPIPFSYRYFGKVMDSVYIGSFGLFFTLDQKDLVTVTLSDAVDRGGSEISYAVSGNTGSRILKIEWKNIGFYMDGSKENFYNVQAWLYENDNNIEIHLGPCSLQNTYSCEYDDDKSILFMDNYDASVKFAIDSNGDYFNDEVKKSCQVIKNPKTGMTCSFAPTGSN